MEQFMNWDSVYPESESMQSENPTAHSVYPAIERRESLSPEEFCHAYVGQGRPVVVTGAMKDCRALRRWTFPYLRQVAGQRFVKLKPDLVDEGIAGLRTVDARLNDYLDQLEAYQSHPELKKRPAYLHDVPLLSVLPDAAGDLQGSLSDYFPAWYGRDMLRFAQFFLGPKHSLTPLHFDCLLTHNLFFQVAGRKRFILLDHSQLRYCYRYRWRWCEVDAENPDFSRHPLFREARVQECTVEPGDLLYMPPGTLHHVRSLDCAISFNVDWHTRASAIRGVLALGRGMPIKNVYYNAVIALGQCAGLSSRQVLPWFRSYLNYVS